MKAFAQIMSWQETNCQIYLCTGIVNILLATMVFKTFLQGVDTRRSCRIFPLQIILNKIKPRKATRYALSLITWTSHSKKATWMSLSKTLMSIWSSSRDVFQWDNIWKWNQLDGFLNGGLDVRAQIVICMNLINIFRKKAKRSG